LFFLDTKRHLKRIPYSPSFKFPSKTTSPIGSGNGPGKKSLRSRNVREFYFETGKIDILKKKSGKIDSIRVTVISTMFFLNEESKFVENLLVLNEWGERGD
jgi:hypothetical protein